MSGSSLVQKLQRLAWAQPGKAQTLAAVFGQPSLALRLVKGQLSGLEALSLQSGGEFRGVRGFVESQGAAHCEPVGQVQSEALSLQGSGSGGSEA